MSQVDFFLTAFTQEALNLVAAVGEGDGLRWRSRTVEPSSTIRTSDALQVFVHKANHHTTLTYCGGHTGDGAQSNVTCREDPRDTGLQHERVSLESPVPIVTTAVSGQSCPVRTNPARFRSTTPATRDVTGIAPIKMNMDEVGSVVVLPESAFFVVMDSSRFLPLTLTTSVRSRTSMFSVASICWTKYVDIAAPWSAESRLSIALPRTRIDTLLA